MVDNGEGVQCDPIEMRATAKTEQSGLKGDDGQGEDQGHRAGDPRLMSAGWSGLIRVLQMVI